MAGSRDPIKLYDMDFVEMEMPDGTQISSHRTLRSIRVKSLQFGGSSNEYIVIHFDKDAERHIAIAWRAETERVIPLPPAGVRLPEEFAAQSCRLSAAAARHPLRCVRETDREDSYYSHISIYSRSELVWSNTKPSWWVEACCMSPDGLLLGAVMNWEDGDQREDPALVVYDLRPLFERLDELHHRPFRTFLALIKLRAHHGALLSADAEHPLPDAFASIFVYLEELQEIIFSFL